MLKVLYYTTFISNCHKQGLYEDTGLFQKHFSTLVKFLQKSKCSKQMRLSWGGEHTDCQVLRLKLTLYSVMFKTFSRWLNNINRQNSLVEHIKCLCIKKLFHILHLDQRRKSADIRLKDLKNKLYAKTKSVLSFFRFYDLLSEFR